MSRCSRAPVVIAPVGRRGIVAFLVRRRRALASGDLAGHPRPGAVRGRHRCGSGSTGWSGPCRGHARRRPRLSGPPRRARGCRAGTVPVAAAVPTTRRQRGGPRERTGRRRGARRFRLWRDSAAVLWSSPRSRWPSRRWCPAWARRPCPRPPGRRSRRAVALALADALADAHAPADTSPRRHYADDGTEPTHRPPRRPRRRPPPPPRPGRRPAHAQADPDHATPTPQPRPARQAHAKPTLPPPVAFFFCDVTGYSASGTSSSANVNSKTTYRWSGGRSADTWASLEPHVRSRRDLHRHPDP